MRCLRINVTSVESRHHLIAVKTESGGVPDCFPIADESSVPVITGRVMNLSLYFIMG